jgi:hypothetical protein
MILVVRDIPYLLLPTNFTVPWYHDKGLQGIKKVKKPISGRKETYRSYYSRHSGCHNCYRHYGMASVALSQSIQNDHCVNTLTQNVTCILQQVSVDEKIDVN